MSIKLMSAAWEMDLPATEKMVLLCLCDHANDAGVCWPSVERMAKKCSVSDRTVQRAIKRLAEAKILTFEDAPGRPHKFTIDPRQLVTPDTVSPPTMTTEPPTQCHPTPDTVSPEPSMNHQEPSIDSSSDDERVTVEDVVKGWNTTAAACGLPKVAKLTTERRRKVQARIRDFPNPDDWRTAFRHIRNTPFLLGENDRGWRASFKFLLQPESFASLVEETYGRSS